MKVDDVPATSRKARRSTSTPRSRILTTLTRKSFLQNNGDSRLWSRELRFDPATWCPHSKTHHLRTDRALYLHVEKENGGTISDDLRALVLGLKALLQLLPCAEPLPCSKGKRLNIGGLCMLTPMKMCAVAETCFIIYSSDGDPERCRRYVE